MAQSQSRAAPDLPATKARQGRLGRDVFWVLVVSLVLAVAAVTVAWVWRAPQLSASEANNGKQPAAARTVDAPPSQPIQSAAPPSQ